MGFAEPNAMRPDPFKPQSKDVWTELTHELMRKLNIPIKPKKAPTQGEKS